MPRIDPNQLLKCLTVLLSPKGGIKSKDEVSRLASLMTKFSKKLVSKCIYVMILKATETDFLDTFMSVGGWDLTFNWLSDGISMKNWPLVAELVELLIICPVDIERLKGNNCPKLIKLLSKDPSASEVVRQRACNVVEKWLAIVKGACENNSGKNANVSTTAASEQEVSTTTPHITENGVSEESNEATVPKGVYKITIRNGEKVLAEVISGRTEGSVEEEADNEDENEGKEEKPSSERPILKVVNEDPIAKESLPPKKLAEGKKHQLSLKRKNERKVISPEPEKKSLKEKKKNNVIEKKPKLDLKSKVKEKKLEKEKSKPAKEKSPEEKAQEEKDKQNLMKLITPSIGNLGKIPKKSKDDSKKEERKSNVLKSPTDPKKPLPKDPKKYNISIETRKGEDRPKTVKTFNSRFRSTGLEELPPPPKNSKKKEEPLPIERKPLKRPSPIKEIHIPEKKAKEEEKPEKSQVLSPSSKPKISGLQESDVFADALTAANPVKDVKKRKRRPSNSTSQGSSDPKKENASSKSDEKEAVKPVFKFYQDTLITSEEKSDSKEEMKEDRDDPESPTETYSDENVTDTLSKEELEDEVAKAEQAIDHVRKLEEKKNVEREKNRLAKGILIYMKKSKSTKKTVTFRDQDLVSIKHFELDENERVNVTKTFMDMRQMEKFNERILFQRKLASEDIMEEKTPWRPLIPIDIPSTGETVIPGQNSVEKDIQHARERTTLQAIYFNRSLIPDSPLEPDLEIHAMTEPAVIPLKDTTGNPDSVLSYRDKPWPEPKGYPPGDSPPRTTSPPHLSPHHIQVQPPMMQQQPPQQMVPLQGHGGMYPPQQYPPQGNMQPFMPPALLPTPSDWMGNGDGNMMMGGPPGNDQMMMGAMNPGPGMPPGLLPPPDMYNMNHPHSDFMGPPYSMGGPPQGMYPGGPPGGFSHHQDGGPPNPRNPRPWFRGQDNSRGGGSGGTWRHPSKGGGGWNPSNKMCKFYLKKGICRQNNCAFRHGSGKGGIR